MELRQVVLRGLLRRMFRLRAIASAPEAVKGIAAISRVTNGPLVGIEDFFLRVDVTWDVDFLAGLDQPQDLLDVLLLATLMARF